MQVRIVVGAVRNRDIDMRMNSRLGLLLLASVVTSAPAAAVVKVATYTGSVTQGTDFGGVFGAAGTDLSGAQYIATATYDTLKGERIKTPFGEILYAANYLSTIVSYTITINNVTKDIIDAVFGDYDSYLDAYPGEGGLFDSSTYDLNSAKNHIFNSITPGTDLESNIFITGTLFGNFQLSSDDGEVLAIGELNSGGTLTVSDASPSTSTNTVPEPAGWAMFIAGFGLIGGMLRTRRSAVATA